MPLCEYAKLKVPVSRAALKTDFQNVNDSAKGTSISSSTKTGLLFFFFSPPKRKQIKTPGKSIFPSSLLFTSIRGPRAQMFLRYRKIDSTMSTRPQTENRGWESAGAVQKAHQPSRSLQGLLESGCQPHRANRATWVHRAMPVSEPENTEGHTMPRLRSA